jgi:hypothetical protein
VDALGLAVLAVGTDSYEATWGFKGQFRDGFGHRDDPAVQKHRRHADRVRAGHRRVVLGLHDDEAHLRAGVLWRDEKVHVAEDAAARFVQKEVAQGLVAPEGLAHLPQGSTRGRSDAANDDVTDFALGMGGDDVDGLGGSHGRTLIGRGGNDKRPAAWNGAQILSKRFANSFEGIWL